MTRVAPMPPGHDDVPQRAGLGRAFKAVFWSFFGVRKQSDHESDAARLKPAHVIVAGLVAALGFVVALIVIVRVVVAASS